ncbi:MAG: hypothetical protein ACKOT0_00190 [bacterium]
MLPGLIAHAKATGITLPPQVEDPEFHLTPRLAYATITYLSAKVWPLLGPQGPALEELVHRLGVDLQDAVAPEPTS